MANRGMDGARIAGAKGKPGFLKRWARRKAAAREAKREAGREAWRAALPPQPAQPQPTAQQPRQVDLPAVEDLEAQSDFTPFLCPDVPPALRRQALEKLWRLDPQFSQVDGLDDYAGDFTRPAGAAGVVATAYRIGKGMIADAETAPGETMTGEAAPNDTVADQPNRQGAVSSVKPPDGATRKA